MTDDIVTRLRQAMAFDVDDTLSLLREAANEIERLRDEAKQWRDLAQGTRRRALDEGESLKAERDALIRELGALKSLFCSQYSDAYVKDLIDSVLRHDAALREKP